VCVSLKAIAMYMLRCLGGGSDCVCGSLTAAWIERDKIAGNNSTKITDCLGKGRHFT
jgi:hypothetical protein